MAKSNLLKRTISCAIEPIGDRVVVKPLPAEAVSPGGIVLPDQSAEKPQRGHVMAIGPGVEPSDRKPGCGRQVRISDEVLYSPYAQTVKIDNEDFVILNELEILAILR